jgi:4-amino-4-deoxy-L-arabinose transferase-like glycosyltransferase
VPALVRLQRNGVSQENAGSLMASVRHRRRVMLWLLLGLAAALRVWKIGDKNLWLDESLSWESATSSVRQLIWNSATDIHPPLYYLSLKLWIWMWGDSLAAMRSLSAIASVVALYLLFRLVDGVMPAGACYAVVLWCALSPHEVHYAQEIRMYAPLTAATLGLCLAYRRWIDSAGERRWPLILYAVATAIALSFHYFAALVVGALWLHFVVGGGRRAVAGRAWKGWLVANAIVAIGYLPWAIAAVIVSKWKAWFTPVSIAELPRYAAGQLRWMTFGYYDIPGWQSWSYVVTLGVLGGGGALLLAAIVRGRDERDAFFACVAYVPVLVGVLLIPAAGAITLARYLPYATPLMVAAAALGWTRTALTPRSVTAIVCIGGLGLLPSLSAYYSAPTKGVDPRPIVAYLTTHVRHATGEAPDPVFVAPGYVTGLMRYYSHSAIDYHKATGSDVQFAGPDFARGEEHPWIVVERAWPNFHDLDRNRRLIPVDVPGNDPNKMRLFRIARD